MVNKVESTPYVDAISLLIADGGRDLDSWLDKLNFISLILDNSPEFNDFYKNPMVADKQVFDFLSSLYQEEYAEDKEFNNFIKLLIKNKRLLLASSICYMLMNMRSKENIYEIETPYILTDKELNKIDIEKGSIIEKQIIDRRLISGIKVRSGSGVIDLSIRGRLDNFKLHIMSRG